ncbi:MAG: hypothetical protein AAF515_21580 [Pseudomonadota bacterium]
MCALGYHLEAHAIASVCVTLVRENAAALQPPRALWVPFPLGRPMGAPNAPAFQRRVLRAGLDLLRRDAGPVLEDFPDDAPASAEAEAPACPVSFGAPATASWSQRLTQERAALAPWYELSRRRRDGRTLVGLYAGGIDAALITLADCLQSDRVPDIGWLKPAIEDLKSYYLEALTAQPGRYAPEALDRRIWFETELGAALHELHRRYAAHPRLHPLARIVLPRAALEERPDEPGPDAGETA